MIKEEEIEQYTQRNTYGRIYTEERRRKERRVEKRPIVVSDTLSLITSFIEE